MPLYNWRYVQIDSWRFWITQAFEKIICVALRSVGILAALLIPRLATAERRFQIIVGLWVAGCLASLSLLAAEGPVMVAGLVCQGVVRATLMSSGPESQEEAI